MIFLMMIHGIEADLRNEEYFQQQIIADLLERKIPFIKLEGDLNQRINIVSKVIENFELYKNYIGNTIMENLS